MITRRSLVGVLMVILLGLPQRLAYSASPASQADHSANLLVQGNTEFALAL